MNHKNNESVDEKTLKLVDESADKSSVVALWAYREAKQFADDSRKVNNRVWTQKEIVDYAMDLSLRYQKT